MRTIFYSWQSNSNKETNWNFIETVLTELIDEFNVEQPNTYILEKDTSGISGFPDPFEHILKKIDASNIFICDLTIVNPHEKTKKLKMPNANVMLELGYAISRLSIENVICIYNEEYGKYDELPSDIRNRIGISYRLNDALEDIESVKKELKKEIRTRIPRLDHVSYSIQLREVKKILCDSSWIAIGTNDHLKDEIDINKCWAHVSIKHLNDNHFRFEYVGMHDLKVSWSGELFLNKDFLRMGKIIWQSIAPDYGSKEIFIIDSGSFYHLFINPINYAGQTYGREVLRKVK